MLKNGGLTNAVIDENRNNSKNKDKSGIGKNENKELKSISAFNINKK